MVKLEKSRCGFLLHRLNAALTMWPGPRTDAPGAGGLTIPERPRDRAVRGNARQDRSAIGQWNGPKPANLWFL